MSVRAITDSTENVELNQNSQPICSPKNSRLEGRGALEDRPRTARAAISAPIVEQARAKFEQRCGRPYTEHEVREALGTLSDFVRLLIEWDQNPVSEFRIVKCPIDADAVDTDP